MANKFVWLIDWRLSFSTSGSGFHALCILQWPVQQVYDWKHHSENGVCWSARLQYLWQGLFSIMKINSICLSWNYTLPVFHILKFRKKREKSFLLFFPKQNLTTLCHLDQLLLVTHINLSSNQLQRLPPQFAMLQCLEVIKLQFKSNYVSYRTVFLFLHIYDFFFCDMFDSNDFHTWRRS